MFVFLQSNIIAVNLKVFVAEILAGEESRSLYQSKRTHPSFFLSSSTVAYFDSFVVDERVDRLCSTVVICGVHHLAKLGSVYKTPMSMCTK